MTVEQIMELVSDYASEIADIASSESVFAHIGKSRYAYRDKTLAELRTAIEELAADAARYRTVLGMPSDVLLRLYNTRFDLRQQVIDAAMEST